MANILFVENDPMTADIYQKKFVSSGFDCETASSVAEALHKISVSKFDLILLELVLGEESGLEMLRSIRTDDAYDTGLKVVVFSDSTDRDIHKQALALGVNGFLVKLDYAPQRLVGEVQRFLHQFEEQRKNAERFRNGGVPIPKNKTVLLVEDEDVFVDMFGRRLRNEGYDVDVAMNGNQGFEKASTKAYDLIITDMVMAGLNGKELIDRLKGDERTKDIPVFLFSASVGNDVLNDIRCQGIKCFMKTHITPSELVREVNAFLESD